MTSIRRIRRNESEWAAILAEYKASGLAARVFCEQANLTMKSFSRWRRRLQPDTLEQAEFVAVTAEEPSQDRGPTTTLDVEIDLGDGMTLRIRRS
ncbi:MAG: hypothetical protein ACE5HV_18455 [Acidobacteriota bacterium]